MAPRGSWSFPDAFPFEQVEEALRQVFVRHWSEDNGRAHCHGNSRACSSSVRYCGPAETPPSPCWCIGRIQPVVATPR